MSKQYLLLLLLASQYISCLGQFSEELLKKAGEGSVTSQIELAKCYLTGNGIDESQYEALKWFEKAAELNNTEAMVACGDLLMDEWNFDLEPDYVKGMEWYRSAANKGDKIAKDRISNFAVYPEDVSHECPFGWLPFHDELDQVDFIRENLKRINEKYLQNNPIALYYLAILAFDSQDYSRAFSYLQEAYSITKKDDYELEFVLGENIEDFEREECLIENKVCSFLGWCYEFGLGVAQNYVKAAEYYLEDFDYWAFGNPTIPKVRGAFCLKKAKLFDRFVHEASTQGIRLGGSGYSTLYLIPCLQLELAEMYKTGEGIALNKKEALSIYEKIVDLRKHLDDIYAFNMPELRSYSDIGKAAYRAAKMYQSGEGCNADSEMSELYLEIALKFGDKNAWYENQNKK